MRNKIAASLLLLFLAAPLPAQYQMALPGYQYEFPRDHFNHPDYKTEWWYYTGNLKSADGHKFGFELTFFRQGIRQSQRPTGDWDIQDLYLAHFALSDLSGGHFYHTERLNRAGPGLAGANLALQRVWNGNWQVQWMNGEQHLQAVSDDFTLQLVMTSHKPPVIHGKNGVSQKSAGLGHASHYISFTRLLTTGSIELKGKTYKVEGTAWMDHEFFSHRLDEDQSGWDWLSLQLDDNTELMLYRLRHKDGSVDPFSSGTYVDAAGKSTYLSLADFSMQPKAETYTSPATHGTYPIAWRVAIPSLGLNLQLKTPLSSQELTIAGYTSLAYWEGAITVSGTRKSAPVSGVGYLEMTGYARPVGSEQAR
ncbi:MAG: lipocalin-like domain-containing protein [Candidatus Korobacteraceae bacterium]